MMRLARCAEIVILDVVLNAGNHEYDYRWSKGRRRSDPSGSGDPYEPDWGNYGACCFEYAHTKQFLPTYCQHMMDPCTFSKR